MNVNYNIIVQCLKNIHLSSGGYSHDKGSAVLKYRTTYESFPPEFMVRQYIFVILPLKVLAPCILKQYSELN